MITATEAMRQAIMTAHDYFLGAITSIDEQFGVGYAKKHPELIAAFMATAAQDFDSWVKINLQ